ncbi:MAG: hypothetical protein ACR2RV_00885 [Verrucomicrobiales bacterium]
MNFIPTVASLGIFRSPAPTAIFILCLLVSGCVLLYYAKRHPHPRFRPKFGELVLVGMIFFGISIALTAMTSGLFEQENLDEKAKQAKKRSSPMRSTGGSDSDSDGKGGGASEDIFKEELPPFVPEGE